MAALPDYSVVGPSNWVTSILEWKKQPNIRHLELIEPTKQYLEDWKAVGMLPGKEWCIQWDSMGYDEYSDILLFLPEFPFRGNSLTSLSLTIHSGADWFTLLSALSAYQKTLKELRIDCRCPFDPFPIKPELQKVGPLAIIDQVFDLQGAGLPILSSLQNLTMKRVPFVYKLGGYAHLFLGLLKLKRLSIYDCGFLAIPESPYPEFHLTELIINQPTCKGRLDGLLLGMGRTLKLLSVTQSSLQGYPSRQAILRHKHTLVYLWLDVRDSKGQYMPLDYEYRSEEDDTDIDSAPCPSREGLDWATLMDDMFLKEICVAVDKWTLNSLKHGDVCCPFSKAW